MIGEYLSWANYMDFLENKLQKSSFCFTKPISLLKKQWHPRNIVWSTDSSLNPSHVGLFLHTCPMEVDAPTLSWGLNFHICYEAGTCTSDSAWQKESID